jgi:tetratricopeptide (TPR) repeat protein
MAGKKKEYDQAITAYTAAIRLDPMHAEAHHKRGLAYEGRGDTLHFDADRRRALSLKPALRDKRESRP